MNPVSIMQGRLSPSENNRFQFFPHDWMAEFAQAKTLGFDGVCWFLDRDIPDFEPVRDIWADEIRLKHIDEAIKILPIRGIDTGRYGFFGEDGRQTLETFSLFLPALAPHLTGQTLSVPLLEDKMPRTTAERQEVIFNLNEVANLATSLNLRLALETEWSAEAALGFLSELDRSNVGICYDIGNATSYGFDCPTEIRTLGAKIFDVHLKDRKVGESQSQLLGTGDADFPACFAAFKEIDYKGGFTLQAWRGENYLEDAKTQLTFVRKCLSSL